MNSPQRLAAALAAIASLTSISGCGSDDDPDPGSAPATSGRGATTQDVPGDRLLDAFGRAASGAVGSIEGYEVDGKRVTLDATTITRAEGGSHCVILTTAAGSLGVPADTEIVVEYSDGSTTCDLES